MKDEEIEAIFIELAKAGEVDRIVRRLAAAYQSSVPHEDVIQYVQDAIEACVRRMKGGTKIKKPAAFITEAAKNMLAKRVERENEPEALATYVRYVAGVRWTDEEAAARRRRALAYVDRVRPAWPTSNVRRTMAIMIEAARADEQLTDAELAERLGCSEGTASSWKSRALRRLRERFAEDGITWDDAVAELVDEDDGGGDPDDDDDLYEEDDEDEEEDDA